MSFKRYDIITFEHNDKVVVLEALLHDNGEYLYVDEINDEETELLRKYKILRVNYETGTLNKITDLNLINDLLPKFQDLLKAE